MPFTEMENLWKMNKFGREKNQKFCICCVQFEMTMKMYYDDRLYEFVPYERDQDYRYKFGNYKEIVCHFKCC